MCSSDLFRNFLYTSLIISAAGILGVWLLMLIFSNRIIRPISESYEKQKRFITDAGHELKTPLTIIDADAELLGMDLGENEWLSDIRMQTRRLADLTRSLIFLAKLEEQQETLPMFDFPLSDIAAETAQSFQALARARGHRLVIHIQPMLYDSTVLRAMSECSSDLKVACILSGSVSAPMQDASTSIKSSSSWVLTMPFLAMISFM